MNVFSLIITVELFVCLAGGIGLIVRGSYMRSQAFSRPSGTRRRGDIKLWQQLLTWQVVNADNNGPTLLEEFSHSRDFIQSSAVIGAGIAIVLAIVGSAAISLATTGTVLSLLAGLGFLLTAGLFFICLVGYSIGYIYGVERLRSLTARRLAYADLQQRRLSDYRSVVFPWVAGILIACAILMPLLLAPYLWPKVSLMSMAEPSVEVPAWVLEAIPAAMLLTLVTGETVAARIARLPRLLLTSNPQTAQRADNLLGAMTIGTLQGFELAVMGYLAFAQWFIIVGHLGQIGTSPESWRPSAIFLVPEALFAWAVGLVGIVLRSLAGRIGGKISGWPWQPVRIP